MKNNTSLQITFRDTSTHDTEALAQLEASAFAKETYENFIYTQKEFEDLLQNTDYVIRVAETPDLSMVGYIMLILKAAEKTANLNSMAVSPSSTGQGFGTLLLQEAERIALKHGFNTMSLEVAENNTVAMNLYAKSSYIPFNYTADFYDDGDAMIEMKKTILSP